MEVVNVPLTLSSNWSGTFYMKRFDELTFGIYLSLNAKVNIPDGDHVLFNIGGGIQLGGSNSPIFRMEYWHNSATDGRYFEVRQAYYSKATNTINAYDYQVKKGDEYYWQGMFCLF